MVPRARNLLYSPRDKISGDLAAHRGVSLRGADAARGLSIRHWGTNYRTLADHCTVCHKCVTPLPGRPSTSGMFPWGMARSACAAMHKKRFKSRHGRLDVFFLGMPPIRKTIKLTRKVMIDWGYKVQRPRQTRRSIHLARAQTKAGPPGHHRQGRRSGNKSFISSTKRHARWSAGRERHGPLLDIEDR